MCKKHKSWINKTAIQEVKIKYSAWNKYNKLRIDELDNYTFLLMYKSLIRPLLEYCNTVWYPCHKQDSQEFEKVQRRATKLVKNLREMTYPARLRALNLPSLVYRRKLADMLQMYRIVTEIDKLDQDNIVKMDLGERTRRHKFKLCNIRTEPRQERKEIH